MAAGGIPLFFLVLLLFLLRGLSLSRERFYLFSVRSVFGSLTFSGIPLGSTWWVGRRRRGLPPWPWGCLGLSGVAFVLTLLELHRSESVSVSRALGRTLRRLARNPLVLVILAGIALGLANVAISRFFLQILCYLSGAMAPLALMCPGRFPSTEGRIRPCPRPWRSAFCGSRFSPPHPPFLCARLLGLSALGTKIVVLLNGTPLALNMLVLSQRYGFYV